jgi:hypothetical protein
MGIKAFHKKRLRNWKHGLYYFANDASEEEAYNPGEYQS